MARALSPIWPLGGLLPLRASLLALLLALVLGGGVAVPAGTAASERVPLSAEVTACETGRVAEDRAVEFTGSMPAISGAVRMAMRFDLYERRADDEDFVRRSVPTFGRWERSDGDVSGFVYDKRVEELDAAADYRTVVQFRWYDASGKVVRSSERTSYICRQADPAGAGR